MAQQTRQRKSRRGIPGFLPVALGVAALVAVAAGLALALGFPQTVPVAPVAVDGCRVTPQFVATASPSSNVALATDGREMGLVLRTVDGGTPVYQHPTWDDAGYLGAIAYDQAGNVYAAPTPRLSLADNPLAGQLHARRRRS